MNKEKRYQTPILATYIQEIYTQVPFDMNLISSDKKKVPIHYTVLALFSKPYRELFGYDGYKFVRGMEIPIDIPYDVLVKLVNFFYNSGIGTGFEMNSSFDDAFEKFELFDRYLNPEEDLQRAIYEALSAPPTRQQNEANDDSDNDELYETFPQVGVEFHKKSNCCGKLYWKCKGSNCNVEAVSKLINGKVMLYKRTLEHSRECEEIRAKLQAEENAVLSADDDDDDNAEYVEARDFPPEVLEHFREKSKEGAKIVGSCTFPGCKGGILVKLIDDKIMAKPLKVPHLAACEMTTVYRDLEQDMDDLHV